MSPDNKIIVVFNIRKNKFCIKKNTSKERKISTGSSKMESRDTMEEVNETKASCLKESIKLKSLYLDEQITGETR